MLHQEPQPIEGVPPELATIIGRCLRKDPERRAQHIADVKIALQELKEDSESGKVAPPVPAPARFRRWVVPAMAALGTLLAAVFIAALWYWLQRSGRESEQGSPNLSQAAFTQLTNQPGEEYYPSLLPTADPLFMPAGPPATGISTRSGWEARIQST